MSESTLRAFASMCVTPRRSTPNLRPSHPAAISRHARSNSPLQIPVTRPSSLSHLVPSRSSTLILSKSAFPAANTLPMARAPPNAMCRSETAHPYDTLSLALPHTRSWRKSPLQVTTLTGEIASPLTIFRRLPPLIPGVTPSCDLPHRVLSRPRSTWRHASGCADDGR